MAKRHKDALGIQSGACNPSAIALCIVAAQQEIFDEGGGTDAVRADPAVRLMVHQLNYLTGAAALDRELSEYSTAMGACERLSTGAVRAVPYWTMPLEEFRAATLQALRLYAPGRTEAWYGAAMQRNHRELVARAIRQGHPVPAAVLADYPQLPDLPRPDSLRGPKPTRAGPG